MTMITKYNVGDIVYRLYGNNICENMICQIRCGCNTIAGDVNTLYSLDDVGGSFKDDELYRERRECAEALMLSLGYEVGLRDVT